jgi:thiamine biosynthesis lipoprotein
VVVTDPGALAAARELVEAELAAIDMACSRFRDDSELVCLNATAGSPRRTSQLLFEAIEVALDAARLTGGAVDPTVGRSLEQIGYDRDLAEIAEDGPPVHPHPAPGWRAVALGLRLDLGATAKALAADRAAVIAAAATGAGVLVSLGGDIAVAGAAPDGGWPIALADDHESHAAGPVVAIEAGGLATSSTTVRRWRRGGNDVHHILDPSTGMPCPIVWRTATVAARTCVQANVASTASIVLGSAAPAWLVEHGLPGRLVDPSGRAHAVGGWREDCA